MAQQRSGQAHYLSHSISYGSFTLRGIKDSPPYLHDGRCFTLEDTVEFFNLVLLLQLCAQEKSDLVAFMKAL
jgi:cytochrome c peroxidase